MKPIEISGGESVYCFNEGQLRNAYDLIRNDPASSRRLSETLERLRNELSRNEQAALAFVMIDSLVNKNID